MDRVFLYKSKKSSPFRNLVLRGFRTSFGYIVTFYVMKKVVFNVLAFALLLTESKFCIRCHGYVFVTFFEEILSLSCNRLILCRIYSVSWLDLTSRRRMFVWYTYPYLAPIQKNEKILQILLLFSAY